MLGLAKGRYSARLAREDRDLEAAQRLRHLAFRGSEGIDSDVFDAVSDHVIVEDVSNGTIVCCFRMMPFNDGASIQSSYSAQFYELSALERFKGPMVEMGRFCIHPDYRDPDILRVAWGAMASYVDDNGVELLFGCASFAGTDAASYADAFAMLKAKHLGPKRWLPQIKAPNVFRYASRLRRRPDAKKAMLRMPPLLRTYLLMGGWVSDHAVIDTDMNTLHVFTGVEIGRIPPERKRLLRSVLA